MQYLGSAYAKKNVGYLTFIFDCTSHFLPGDTMGVGTCHLVWEDDSQVGTQIDFDSFPFFFTSQRWVEAGFNQLSM